MFSYQLIISESEFKLAMRGEKRKTKTNKKKVRQYLQKFYGIEQNLPHATTISSNFNVPAPA